MKSYLEIDEFDLNSENLQHTLQSLREYLPIEITTNVSSFSSSKDIIAADYSDLSVKEKMEWLYHKLEIKCQLKQYPDSFISNLCQLLDKIAELVNSYDLRNARKIAELRLRWDSTSPEGWFQLGITLFQLFVSGQIDNLQLVLDVFKHVLDLVEEHDSYHELGFWAYSYMANVNLYRILSGQEALEGAMKYYNHAYRYARNHNIDIEEEFIFENVEILQKILMNQYPLLVIVYNHTGMKLFEYLFQFVEVIKEDLRFIPNFTAFLSVVDERMNELFNSPMSNAFIVIENRLMVISTLYDEDKKNWIKIGFVFSYLQQSADDLVIDEKITSQVKKFNQKIMGIEEVRDYFLNFNGRHDFGVYSKIEKILHEIFT